MADTTALSGYAMANCSFTIDGRAVTGFDEGDDVFKIERTSPLGTPTVGADGCAVVSFSADESVKITLKLQQSSPFNAFLLNKLAQVRGGYQKPFSVAFTDTTNGESGSGEQAVLIKAPTIQKGVKASAREWEIFVPVWRDAQMNYGTR